MADVKRRLDWIPDHPDFRDHVFSLPQLMTAGVAPPLPRRVDFRERPNLLPPVFDQGTVGSCTAQAVSGAIGTVRPESFRHSRNYIYYNSRVLDGDPEQDAGSSLRVSIKGAASDGACLESLWPYTKSNLFKKPPASCYTDGRKRIIKEYLSLTTTDAIKQNLAAMHPVVFGFTVYSSFDTASTRKTGMIPMPSSSDKKQGGHAVMAVGYDEDKKVWIVRNSWGPAWADKGYFYLPYAYLPMTRDWWTIRA